MTSRPGPLEGLAAFLVGVLVLGLAFAIQGNALAGLSSASAHPATVEGPATTRES